ncbi:MAG: hypothetical protein ACKVOU_15080 [Cytophagales bacterium]
MNKPFEQTSFIVKLTNWEFWPFFVVYFFVIIYHCWLSIKARSFFFFSASNPGIEMGGMLGESKSSILDKIPEEFRAKYVLVRAGTSYHEAISIFTKSTLSFPVIAKPDVGERGQGVQKIDTVENLVAYHLSTKATYIIQEFIDFPVELGIFYYRFPNAERGTISSIVMKDFLKVVGNGTSSLLELIEQYPRARFVRNHLSKVFENVLTTIPKEGQVIELEQIGNHCRGTTFLDANDLINGKLINVFDQLSNKIDGFYYGRYDLRCNSIEDLYEGKNIKILELNGCGAEPAHIYQPGFSFWAGQKVLLAHHHIMYKISMENHEKGIPFPNLVNIREKYKLYKKAIDSISTHHG